MIKSKDEILQAITAAIGSDDAGLTLIEDITDTLGDLETKAADVTNWESKYNELDQSWRQRYHDRFSEGTDAPPAPEPAETKLTFESLFKEED